MDASRLAMGGGFEGNLPTPTLLGLFHDDGDVIYGQTHTWNRVISVGEPLHGNIRREKESCELDTQLPGLPLERGVTWVTHGSPRLNHLACFMSVYTSVMGSLPLGF